MVSKLLDIGDQMPGGVAGEVAIVIGGVRQAAAAVALIEKNDAIGGGVEIAPRRSRAARTGAAMENQGRDAIGIAAAFPVQPIAVARIQHAVVIGFYFREQLSH